MNQSIFLTDIVKVIGTSAVTEPLIASINSTHTPALIRSTTWLSTVLIPHWTGVRKMTGNPTLPSVPIVKVLGSIPQEIVSPAFKYTITVIFSSCILPNSLSQFW